MLRGGALKLARVVVAHVSYSVGAIVDKVCSAKSSILTEYVRFWSRISLNHNGVIERGSADCLLEMFDRGWTPSKISYPATKKLGSTSFPSSS